MLAGIDIEHAIKSSVFEESTNLFIPFYRQTSMKHGAEVFQKDGNIDAALISIPYGDITAALDYYFENFNNGRPFVIAGHSQGSAILRLVLKKYFKEHPDYYKHTVAAYAIGYSIMKDDLEANPHMKFATGETEIRDIEGDAQVCLARGTVVTNAKAVPNEMVELAGPQCYHQDDYSIFYNNIKDNVAKRIAAYNAK